MSVIATAVRHLLAAGVTGEALVAAIADMEASQPVDAVAEKRRAYDRERKRALKSTGIPPESTETPEFQTGPFPSPSSSPDPSNNPTHTPGKDTPARKGTRISDCWKPEALDGADQAMVAAWPPGTIDREMAKFRDFWAAKAGAGGVKRDWQATWRNWLRSADERIPRNGNRTANHRYARPDRSSEIDDAARNLGFGG
ncbi:hypothetical protein [Sphingomonas albertensis]|uniref:hypothetical protein n=1 Tax=Sphingomonas albertensis TaxID=2762591 RepID=UPI0037DA636D